MQALQLSSWTTFEKKLNCNFDLLLLHSPIVEVRYTEDIHIHVFYPMPILVAFMV